MSYNITGYYNSSDKNVLNKTLSEALFTVSGNFKHSTDMINPIIEISYHSQVDWSTCNYIYIELFHRYYYVKSKVYDTFGNITIECQVDVLMSHVNDIKQLSVIALRSTNNFNVYQYDPEVPAYEYSIVATQKFPYGFNSGESIILANNGGGIVI